ncbi:TetR family transcriptional regulator [Solirubrobacter sp. CPCC 204708]|uniref:TetR/AcrR family transcriptional regulator n=1 Tax=Solirubrobacter deserti TaxID=2282478 RepID=A0ABT4RD86_9ACTN|nr:TetR/AcrR family transcriptional regulator [Solirubrobacter deserti]MBE2317740.1 TetR family transcriptional regulator [Solirubrobacter deserti]MDA0136483.1 TetR/AcrR family transcriptional regulator [Solirubrobacter deserti]
MAGLRERKKQATRAAIRQAAMALFDEQGFAATTIDQIAAGAEVSRATVLNYFGTKEDIVFGDAPAAAEALREALAAGDEALTTFRDWLLALVELGGWIEPELVLQQRLAEEAPTVAARRLALHQEFARVIADALVEQFGPDRRVPATLAAASLTAAMEVIEHTAAEHGGTVPRADVDRLLADAVAFAQAGMSAIAQE